MFGTHVQPRELMEQSQKILRKSIRALEQETKRLEQREEKVKLDIKVAAKKGQHAMARTMAKDIVRMRNAALQLYKMRCNLESVGQNMQTMSSTMAMTDAMKGAARAMYVMNRQINLPAIRDIMMQYEKQAGIMEMKQELMDDTMDGVMQQEGDEEEEAAVINQVLDEISIGLAAQLGTVPTRTATATTTAAPTPTATMEDDDMSERINRLRKWFDLFFGKVQKNLFSFFQ